MKTKTVLMPCLVHPKSISLRFLRMLKRYAPFLTFFSRVSHSSIHPGTLAIGIFNEFGVILTPKEITEADSRREIIKVIIEKRDKKCTNYIHIKKSEKSF